MKSFIFATIFFAAVAAGAERSWSLYDVVSPFVNIKEHMRNIDCVRDVVYNVMEESTVSWDWRKSLSEFDDIVTVEWQECLSFENGNQKDECIKGCMERSFVILKEFATALVKDLRFDLLNKIRVEVAAKCVKKAPETSSFFDLDTDEIELAKQSFPEQFECIVDVIGNVSVENGLNELWAEHETELHEDVARWYRCANLGNKYVRWFCNVKEGAKTYKAVVSYVQSAASQNPQVAQQIARQYQQNCGSSFALDTYFSEILNLGSNFYTLEDDSSDEEIEALAGKTENKMICIISHVSQVIEEAHLEDIWTEYREQLEGVFRRIQVCRAGAVSTRYPWETTRCIAEEITKGFTILADFYKVLKATHTEVYQHVVEAVKQNCF